MTTSEQVLREALEKMMEAMAKHDRWCGHNIDAPGDPIFRVASEKARTALALTAPQPVGEGYEITNCYFDKIPHPDAPAREGKLCKHCSDQLGGSYPMLGSKCTCPDCCTSTGGTPCEDPAPSPSSSSGTPSAVPPVLPLPSDPARGAEEGPYRVRITSYGVGRTDTIAIVGPQGVCAYMSKGDYTEAEFKFWCNRFNAAYASGLAAGRGESAP